MVQFDRFVFWSLLCTLRANTSVWSLCVCASQTIVQSWTQLLFGLLYVWLAANRRYCLIQIENHTRCFHFLLSFLSLSPSSSSVRIHCGCLLLLSLLPLVASMVKDNSITEFSHCPMPIQTGIDESFQFSPAIILSDIIESIEKRRKECRFNAEDNQIHSQHTQPRQIHAHTIFNHNNHNHYRQSTANRCRGPRTAHSYTNQRQKIRTRIQRRHERKMMKKKNWPNWSKQFFLALSVFLVIFCVVIDLLFLFFSFFRW